ncbi:hypothetical protein [Acaryochloris sp. IP29b_bin.137]|uniref:hypothetical protein n=1 Tax=Acaryochloris sp. IP29b_bin.137 TaxID=2969217 RepID=UPI00261D1D68|nr:hypothetical protein [Acaryochloris sp. IP29b_bin.137]
MVGQYFFGWGWRSYCHLIGEVMIIRDLERQFQKLNLSQKRLAQQTRKRVRLEYLRVSKTGEEQYWIIEKVTRKAFMQEVFDTSKFCWECALELESTFDIQQVIELRPPEAIERIEEIVKHHSGNEWHCPGASTRTRIILTEKLKETQIKARKAYGRGISDELTTRNPKSRPQVH